jgi:hypothetical protein
VQQDVRLSILWDPSAGDRLIGQSVALQHGDPVSGGGISVTGAGVKVDTAVVVRKYAQSIGDGSTTAIAVTHSLGTKDITYSIREVSTDAFVDVDCVATSTTVATFTFPTAPASNAYRVVIHC